MLPLQIFRSGPQKCTPFCKPNSTIGVSPKHCGKTITPASQGHHTKNHFCDCFVPHRGHFFITQQSALVCTASSIKAPLVTLLYLILASRNQKNLSWYWHLSAWDLHQKSDCDAPSLHPPWPTQWPHKGPQILVATLYTHQLGTMSSPMGLQTQWPPQGCLRHWWMGGSGVWPWYPFFKLMIRPPRIPLQMGGSRPW